MEMKKIASLALSLSLCAGLLAGCGDNGNGGGSNGGAAGGDGDKPESYKVAFIGSFTGNQAQYGESQRASIEMYLEKFNADGGVDGVPVVVDWYDDKSDPKETVTVGNKILGDDSVIAAIGPFSSTSAMAIAPMFEEAGITLYSPSSSHPDFTNMGEYMFRGTPTQEYYVQEYAKYISDVMGCKKIGMIYVNSDYGVVIHDLFIPEIQKYGGELVVAENYIVGQTKDFSPLISKIKTQDIDCLYIVGHYAEGAQIISQAKKLQLDVPYIGTASLMKQELIDICGDAADGFLLLNNFTPDNDAPGFQEWLAEFEERNPNISVDAHVVNTYDTIDMICQAIQNVGADRAAVRDWINAQAEFPGIGGTFSMAENGDAIKPLFPMIVKDGHFVSNA